MKTSELVLLAYSAFDGKMKGKTKLQKILYFLGIMLEEDLGYEAHYYGPYSSLVANTNSKLSVLGFLEENTEPWGINSEGFEVARYDYNLTPEAEEIIERKKRELEIDWIKIKEKADQIKSAGDVDYMVLSFAAKAHFILTKEGGKATIEKIEALFPKFGWKLPEGDLPTAINFLEKIGLVKKETG
jgi:uncharacterized protein YwgA